ncbi:hypothetical protein ACLOAV_010822 [Pseudogymnoascus australis]
MVAADEKRAVLRFVEEDQALPVREAALRPKPQRINCSLALAVARAWLYQTAPDEEFTEEDIVGGIKQESK